jgi:hypothetical protein
MRVLLAAALCLWNPAGYGEEGQPATAGYVLPGCKTLVALYEGNSALTQYLLQMGYCAGIVDAVVVLNSAQQPYPADRPCIPQGVTNAQAIRVATSYVDARPERHHQSFALLALDAFRAAWPCKK